MTKITYKYDDVLKKSTEYFNGDEFSASTWLKKYALKDSKDLIYESSPDDMHKRIASELSRIEQKYINPLSYDVFYEMLKNFKYLIPGGSSMTGIGNDLQVSSLGNCFVINEYCSDSYGGILRIDEEQVQLMKRRGGVGHDLSHLRPDKSPVNNSALTSTGVVSFMERYSNSTREVAQGGRRGALMLSVSIKHPDSEKFIDAKLSTDKITGANVSVKIHDDFMDSVINNKPYIQQFPIDSEKPSVVKTIDANKLWNKIIHNAWKSAEPGILFWDTIIKESPADCYADFGFRSTSTNPCFSGKSELLTIDGYKTFKSLCDTGDITILNKNGDARKSKVWCTGTKKVVKFTNTLNEEFICTPDHTWKLNDDKTECQAKDLKNKRLMPYLNSNINHNDLYVKLGFIQGDGNLSRLSSESHNGFEINIGINDNDVLDYFGFKQEQPNQRKYYTDLYFQTCKDLEFYPTILINRNLPKTFNSWSELNKKSFIKGLYSANGSIIKNNRISFKSVNFTLINEIKNYLDSIGISSYYTTNKSKKVKFENGEYLCKESYDLNISSYNSMIKFYENIGFIHKYKNTDLYNLILLKSPMIKSVKDFGEELVYDFIEPETHWGVVNGYIAHNCGELPLAPYDSCRLLSINLYSYVVNPFTTNAYFDFDLFKKHCSIAQRVMDNIIDLEIEKIDKILSKIESDSEPDDIKEVERRLWINIRKKAVEGRRSGNGITAEGDMLAALGLTYGSEEAIKHSTEVHKVMAIELYKSSVNLAKERGSFIHYNPELEINNPFINRLKDADEELYNDMIKYGRRNIGILTIAPTGTVSILTQTTSGIEPAFMITYKRRRKVNPNDPNIKVSFVDDLGDSWEEFNVFHHKFITWLEVNGYNVDEVKEYSDEKLQELIYKSPYYKSTANDIDWVSKVKLQGNVQKWIDHSISVTVNLPENTTEKTVNDVYIEAFKSGCKGITVYRDGSRSGVLTKKDDKGKCEDNKFTHNSVPKRPKSLDCDIHQITAMKQKYIVLVGLKDGKPYEVFAFMKKNIELPSKYNKGKLVKVKSGVYNLEIHIDEDKIVLENLGELFETSDEQIITKLISGCLRHGMHMNFIINILDSVDSTVVSFGKSILRVLVKYENKLLKEKKGGDICPNCGSTLLKTEGCAKCTSCDYSLCG